MHPIGIRPAIVDRVLLRRGRLHLHDRLDPARTALVVIDMQEGFVAPGAPAEVPAARAICANINTLAAALRARGGKVVWVLHANATDGTRSDWSGFMDNFVAAELRHATIAALAPGGKGQAVWRECTVAPGDLTVTKNRYSAMIAGSSALERTLRSFGIDTVLIAGTKTNVCCESTARDAMMLDFKVVMVEDACAALSDEEHRATLENIVQQFGDVRTTADTVGLLGPPR
ncbi:MAG: cysteine hydrolase [Alphaproteobacteria bacterium]|nr:cysteine hydrolase [Alphaproteobacteria bacterium]